MNGFTENRASGPSEQLGACERILSWHASRAMLPLAGRIAHDIADRSERLATLRPELEQLDRDRVSLDWPRRRRRYQLEDEVAQLDGELRCLALELEALGVTLLEVETGLVGFPTLVNERLAYFSWMPGEPDLEYWNYAGDYVRRPVPEDWMLPASQVRGRHRKSKK